MEQSIKDQEKSAADDNTFVCNGRFAYSYLTSPCHFASS